MKEALYSWMESLVCYYLLFAAVMNILPDNNCKKYIRYYMGLLLIFIILSPVFRVTGIQDTGDAYLENWEAHDDSRSIWEEKAEIWEKDWEKQLYEEPEAIQGQEVLP